MLWDAETEIAYSRVFEISAESIPSGVLQLRAYLKAKQRTNTALASIIVSAVTIAFAGVVISWDLDTSPKYRKKDPEFFGYIKNDPFSRTWTFLAMMTFTFPHVLMKMLSTALLLNMSRVWAFGYMGGEILLYFLVKAARGDLRYHDNLPEPASSILTVADRVVIKSWSTTLSFFSQGIRMRSVD